MNSVKITTSYPTIAKPLTVLFSVLVIAWWLEIGLRMPMLAAFRFEFVLAALASVLALMQRRPVNGTARGADARGADVRGAGVRGADVHTADARAAREGN